MQVIFYNLDGKEAGQALPSSPWLRPCPKTISSR